MITQLSAKNFGCLRDVTTPQLGKLHAFIGPNDSGKSTLLRAARVQQGWAGGWVGEDPAFIQSTAAAGSWRVVATTPAGTVTTLMDPSSGINRAGPVSAEIVRELSPVRLLRLDPDALRLKSGLIPAGQVLDISTRGTGLPGVYDAILSRGDLTFFEIADQLKALFPSVAKLRLRAVSQVEKELEIELRGGTVVPASAMSEGMLYYLAYAALSYLRPVAILQIEEPENGLHPARISDVVRVLRAVSERGTQVMMATHSPLVVNELAPDEVTVVTRDPDAGTQVRLLADTPGFAERSKVYAPGELWLSYADGQLEAPLLGSPKT